MIEFLIANALYVGMVLILAMLIGYGSWALYAAGAQRGYYVAQAERERGYGEEQPRPRMQPRQPRPPTQQSARGWSLNDVAGYLSAVVVAITLVAVLVNAFLPVPVGAPTGGAGGQPQPTARPWSPPPVGQPQPASVPAAAPPVAEPPASELIPIVEPAPAAAPVEAPAAAPPAEPIVSDLVPIAPTPHWGTMNNSGGSFDAALRPTPLPEGVYWGNMNSSGGAVEQPTAASGGGRSGGGWGP